MLCTPFSRMSSVSPLSLLLQPLWPASRDLFSVVEQEMTRTVAAIKERMQQLDQFHQQLMQEITLQQDKTLPVQGSCETSKDGGFMLCLGVGDFSPQELTVKILGRKLLVTGAKESKTDDGRGSFSYKCQILRKESDLPQDINVDELSCTVSADGQLRIEAPRVAPPAGQERTVPIQLSGTNKSIQSTETTDSAKETENSKDSKA
ncbi:heat shock protein beta-11-like [Bombina bombina]|uniref:heat shock protein beta-11-like n=1 Tax=Bombina bombina TaxID=8345 RepID=UPI00235B070C|nr:heat shock protein beta-11-like [Bombina bombina]